MTASSHGQGPLTSLAGVGPNAFKPFVARAFVANSVFRSALLGSLIGTAVLHAPAVLAEPRPTSPPQAAASNAPRAVKMIGAFARSDACEEQVWPYIESRCLTRPKPSAAPANEIQTPPVEQPRGGAAATARQDGVPQRAATAHLSLPRTPVARRDAMLSETDGSGGQRSSLSTEAQTGGKAERPRAGEPRRRTSRRDHRYRRGSSVAFFPFRF